MAQPMTYNVVGAVIFFTYIAAALFFTGFIALDLLTLYRIQDDDKSSSEQSRVTMARRRDIGNIFVALSAISFAVLSYQMLSFLILSYIQWSSLNGISLPTTVLGHHGILDFRGHRTSVYAWTWSTQSTLFQDFAQTIVDDPRHFWWTQQALLYSLGWNTYMAVEGTRSQIPHLWAYFILDQILPISFTQNLFCAVLFLKPKADVSIRFTAAAPGDQFAIVLPYLLSLSAAPQRVGTSSFFLLIFAIRALLFTPYWMMRPSVSLQKGFLRSVSDKLWWDYRYFALVLGAGGFFLHVRQSQAAMPLVQTVKAIGDNPAVAALGYDYVIGVISLGVLVAAWQV